MTLGFVGYKDYFGMGKLPCRFLDSTYRDYFTTRYWSCILVFFPVSLTLSDSNTNGFYIIMGENLYSIFQNSYVSKISAYPLNFSIQ